MGFDILFLGVSLVGFGVPVWIALRTKRLTMALPYRWATWLAIETGLLALSAFAFVAESTSAGTGLTRGGVVFLILGFLSLFGTVGLFRRNRPGVVFLIASEVLVALLGPLTDSLYLSVRHSSQPGAGFPVLVLIVVNVIYFKKRWPLMAPGLLGCGPSA